MTKFSPRGRVGSKNKPLILFLLIYYPNWSTVFAFDIIKFESM